MEHTIGFAKDLVPLVKSGQKTLTYRLGGKYDFLKPGDIIKTKDSENGEIFAELIILNKWNTTFGKLPINKEGHESYSSKEEQREKFRQYYNQEINDDDHIIVLEFKIKALTTT